MANFFLRSRPTVAWAASQTHALGIRRIKLAGAFLGIHFEVTTAGTTGGSEPAWNTTVGGTTTDNTVTWTTRGSADTWVTLTTYVAGDRAVPTTAAAAADRVLVLECTTGGLTGAEPNWNNTVGGTTADGTAVWTTREATTWDNAHIFIDRLNASATSAPAAGDTLYVGDEHAETQAAALVINLRGSGAAPIRVLCVNDTGDPTSPSTLATSGAISSSGTFPIDLASAGTCIVNGLAFNAGVGGGSSAFSLFVSTATSSGGIFTNCKIKLNGNTGSRLIIGNVSATAQARHAVTWRNTTVEFGDVAQNMSVRDTFFTWLNTASAIVGATIPTVLIVPAALGVGVIRIEGVDFSAIVTGKSLINVANGLHQGLVRNCSIGIGGGTTTGTHAGMFGAKFSAINIDSAPTRTAFENNVPGGKITSELTIVRTGGAHNGQEAYSWKVVTDTAATYDAPLESFPIRFWNTRVGVARTVTVEIISSTTLTDAQVWAEVEFLGSTTVPLSTFSTDAAATTLTTGTNQPTSSATWASSPATPVKQTLDVTFTPQMIGFITARVMVAIASTTLYIDPHIKLV